MLEQAAERILSGTMDHRAVVLVLRSIRDLDHPAPEVHPEDRHPDLGEPQWAPPEPEEDTTR